MDESRKDIETYWSFGKYEWEEEIEGGLTTERRKGKGTKGNVYRTEMGKREETEGGSRSNRGKEKEGWARDL